jgi:hypothetical protein
VLPSLLHCYASSWRQSARDHATPSQIKRRAFNNQKTLFYYKIPPFRLRNAHPSPPPPPCSLRIINAVHASPQLDFY